MKKLYLLFSLLSFIFIAFGNNKDTVKVVNLNSIEVTGVRPGSNSPISQKTITGDLIVNDYKGQEMVYILEKTPSITTQSDGGHPNGYTYFRLRGIDQTRINVTMDGVPMNEPEDQGAYYSNYPNFAMYINSMQVQRGVGASSNGTSSYAGSINYETRNGVNKGGLFALSSGSFSTMSTSVTYGTGLNKNISFFGGASGYSSDGYRYHSGGKGSSLFLSGGYYGNENIIKFVLLTGKSENQMAWFAVPESQIKIDRRTNMNPVSEDDNFKQTTTYIQFINKVSDKSILSNTVFYTRLDGIWDMFLSSDNIFEFNLKSNFFGLLSNLRYSTGNLKFNSGVNISGYNRTHIGVLDDIVSYDNIGYKKDFSGYAKAEYLINKFTLFGDLQLRHVDFKYNGVVAMDPFKWLFFNPRGGISCSLTDKSKLFASIGMSHREPTRSDLFGGSDDLLELNIVKPESVVDYEIGYDLSLDKFKMKTNLFYMDFKDEIILAGAIGTNSLPLMTSVDKSYRTGIENDISYHVNKNIYLSNTVSYMHSRIVGENVEYAPLYSPEIIINQGIGYKINNFNLNINGRYVSNSYINFDNTETIPAYFILNSTISYTVNNIVFSFDGLNLLNTKYYTGGYQGENENNYYVGAPISFYTTIKIKL